MAISGDYPTQVTVNGFACKNCTDVDYAKKHIDSARPKDGPYGVNAKDHRQDKPFNKLDEAASVKRPRVRGLGESGALVDLTV